MIIKSETIENMIIKLQSLKSKTKKEIKRTSSNYYDEMHYIRQNETPFLRKILVEKI